MKSYNNEKGDVANIEFEKISKEISNHFEGTLEENQSSLAELVNILGDIVECLGDAKIQVPSWKYHLQTLVNKMIFTSNSIIKLSHGSELQSFSHPSLNVPIIDFSTIYILTRVLIENYVTFCYIYNNNLPEEEKIFRYKLWQVSGLKTRQNFDTSNGYFDEEKLKSEAVIMTQILSEIEAMPEYNNLKKEQLKKLKDYGLPRKDSWGKLISESNLREPIFSNLYGFLCGYAHSEYISIMQISQTSSHSQNPENREKVNLALNNVRTIIALTSHYYIENYSDAKTYFDKLPLTHRTVIDTWAKIWDKNSDYNNKNKIGCLKT